MVVWNLVRTLTEIIVGKSRIRGSLSLTAAIAVVAGSIAAPVAADGSDSKALEDSKAAEQATTESLSSIEVELAQLAAENNELGNKAADAKAAQLEAEAKLQDALDEAVYANKAADDAAAKVEDAKQDLGQVSAAMYRDGAGMLPGAEYLLGGSSFEEATQYSRAYDLVGQDADKRVQEFEALQDVANSMRDEATAKTEKYQKAADKAKKAADDAAAEEKESTQRLDEISTQREELVTQLAAQKGTTAKIERDLQDKKEAKAKEEAKVAQQEKIEAAEALFTENADQAPVADNSAEDDAASGEEATDDAAAGDEAAAGEDTSESDASEPAETSEPTSEPTQPEATTAPKPTATSTPAPKPTKTQAPAPKPTKTQAPAPKPTKTQTPTPKRTQTTPSKPKPSTGSAAAIVSKAKSFIGIPYVWGGKSPSGWDCIGFVQYVYSLQGVTINGYNRTSFTPSVGYTVPYSQAKPGDILFWPGHVAISLGGGQNIGAWNPGMGTRIGPDSWIGTPSKVVRVFG
ncbi:C40 family peptidase [Ancrocorticia populi]|uniref:C40 family peptidase n=1 Tax=Ancrocorticia populi TaxID=2175228 RepID=UPI003F9E8EB6